MPNSKARELYYLITKTYWLSHKVKFIQKSKKFKLNKKFKVFSNLQFLQNKTQVYDFSSHYHQKRKGESDLQK